MTIQEYGGQELDLFARARRWKGYYAALLKPWIGRRVVETGAGMGATTPFVCDGSQEDWLCLEPDPALKARLDERITQGKLPQVCRAQAGTLDDLKTERFDTIIYIDVLEHIRDDGGELHTAVQILEPGGRLIVLAPAHPGLYSPFDQAIGHFRRYDKKALLCLTPASCVIQTVRYLDSVGLLLSLANKLFLRQNMPTMKQIQFWDGRIIPISIVLDRRLGFRFGKSILAVWRRV